MSSQRTQEQRILWLLQASYPNWTPAPALAEISLQYCARVHSARRKGWLIDNKVEIVNGVKHGFYRLAQPMTWPKTVHSAGVANIATHQCIPPRATGQLFPESAERYHRDDG